MHFFGGLCITSLLVLVWVTRSRSLSKHFGYTLYNFQPELKSMVKNFNLKQICSPDGSTSTGHDNARQHSLERPPIAAVASGELSQNSNHV